ncbi:MAG: efflux RND transporter periplasmic adaptor subunit [Flavobacterium sp.]|nr:efflux RND transporter periplasmic adaptor subunit [Flavobacterium sp.]
MKNIIKIACLILTITACNSNKKEQKVEAIENQNNVTLTNEQLKNVSIETTAIEQRTISTLLKLNGQVDVPPQNMISVSMPLGGYLKSTKLLPGLHFSKGEIIAVMEDQQYIQLQQDYLITKSKLNFAEKEFVRQKELNQSQASSDKVYQLADTDYKTLRITLRSLAEKLKLIHINPNRLSEKSISKSVNIYAPINGYVSKLNVNIGKYVNPSDVLFELINPLDIHLNLKIFEKDVIKLQIGQKLVAYTNNDINKKHLCEIILISKDLSAEHTAEVHCHFENYDKNLLPGMYMNAEIRIKNNKSFALPTESVVNFEGKNYVFVVKNLNNFLLHEVQIGTNEDEFIEVLNYSDFKQNKIVTKGAYTLLMKLKNKSDE